MASGLENTEMEHDPPVKAIENEGDIDAALLIDSDEEDEARKEWDEHREKDIIMNGKKTGILHPSVEGVDLCEAFGWNSKSSLKDIFVGGGGGGGRRRSTIADSVSTYDNENNNQDHDSNNNNDDACEFSDEDGFEIGFEDVQRLSIVEARGRKNSIESAGSENAKKNLLVEKRYAAARMQGTYRIPQKIKPSRGSYTEDDHARAIQTIYRGWRVRQRTKALKICKEKLIHGIRSRNLKLLQPAFNTSTALSSFFMIREHEQAKAVLHSLKEEENLNEKLKSLVEQCKNPKTPPLDRFQILEETYNRIHSCRLKDSKAFRSVEFDKFKHAYLAACAQRSCVEMLENLLRVKPSPSPRALADAVYFYDNKRKEFSEFWPACVAAKPYADCRSLLIQFQHEEGPIRDVLNACTQGYAGVIVSQNLEVCKLDVTKIDVEALGDAVRVCEELEMNGGGALITLGAMEILNLGRKLIALRISLKYSLEHGEGWEEVSESISECEQALLSWTTRITSSSSNLDHPTEVAATANDDEIAHVVEFRRALSMEFDSIQSEIDRRVGVLQLLKDLESAMHHSDTVLLSEKYKQSMGSPFALQNRKETEIQSLMNRVKEYLPRLEAAYVKLVKVLISGGKTESDLAKYGLLVSTAKKNGYICPVPMKTPDDLREAIGFAQRVEGFGSSHSKDGWLLEEAIRLLTICNDKILPFVEDYAKTIPDRGNMEALVRICEVEGLDVPKISELRGYVNLPDDRLQQEQLRAATRNGDQERKCELMIRIRDCVLSTTGTMFNLSEFKGLKDPEVWARGDTSLLLSSIGGSFKKKQQGSNMLFWSSDSLPSSLTILEAEEPAAQQVTTLVVASSGIAAANLQELRGDSPSNSKSHKSATLALKKQALGVFKNIQIYMGDREAVGGVDPVSVGQEVLVVGLAMKPLRDEIYVQLMKQLTRNPNDQSRKFGWSLMNLCCGTFPPNPKLEFFLEKFLQTNPEKSLSLPALDRLHNTIFIGERPCAPSFEQVAESRLILPSSSSS